MVLYTGRPESVIHHSDQGSQYTSVAFGKRCEEMDVKPSMGTVGDGNNTRWLRAFSQRWSVSSLIDVRGKQKPKHA